MKLGPKRPSLLWFWDPNSIIGVYMDPLGLRTRIGSGSGPKLLVGEVGIVVHRDVQQRTTSEALAVLAVCGFWGFRWFRVRGFRGLGLWVYLLRMT